MNPIFERICAEVSVRPQMFNMHIWGYCLAGWAALYSGHQIGVDSFVAWSGPYKGEALPVVAMHVLELPDMRIFFLKTWPLMLVMGYELAKDREDGPALAEVLREAYWHFNLPLPPQENTDETQIESLERRFHDTGITLGHAGSHEF